MLQLFQYSFFQNAAWASLFAAISCGIIGTYIVSRRIVFISGGITHASFGGIGISYFFGLNPLLGAAVFALLSSLGIEYFTRSAKVREDSSIAIWWSLGMAVGILFIYLTPGYAPNLMSYLFGSILTVSHTELLLMAALSVLLIGVFTLMQRSIIYAAFNESFAKTTGLPVKSISYFMMCLIALAIVLHIRVVGIVLIMSLLSIPQATANLFTKNYQKMMWLSVLVAFVGTFGGLLLSFYADIPSGATIILVLISIFALCKLRPMLRRLL